VPTITTSHLEEARDIHYGPIGDNDDEDGQEGDEQDPEQDPEADRDGNLSAESHNDELDDNQPAGTGLCILRRSKRIRAKTQATREPSPLTALSTASNGNRIQKRRKKNQSKTTSVTGRLRRSARLAKPLDAFHKYPDLPPEIQLMIWEAAVEPRLTYICNRSSILGHAQNFGVQNKLPTWFMVCGLSVYVAKRCYRKLFGHNSAFISQGVGIPSTHQDINPDVDIVVYEPCHSGCRGYYCAQQYLQEDRAAALKLAVQIDSPHLPIMSEPGWATISKAWPNVETLFMMKPAIRGLDQSDKAMLRIKEDDHEVALRKLFEAWKKGVGHTLKLTTLEFVRVVEKEAGIKNIKDRYQLVEDRKTGLVEDIILG
jgi:hypothetical protein